MIPFLSRARRHRGLTAALAGAAFTLLAAPAGAATHPPQAASGVYYEIFVRSFADSNGDGVGDLNGITARLDYLKWLGVSGLWLTPIYPSASYHGYDVTNYFAINPQFGTMADFRRLLREAHARGIKVLIDMVLNHTSDRNPWFEQALDPKSPYHDWYTWAGKGADLSAQSSVGQPAWHRRDGQYYLGDFSDGMPDLNYDNPAVRREMIKVGRFWLAQGVDGFRLDATTQIYIDFKSDVGSPRAIRKNIAWWRQYHDALRAADPDVFLLGEVPADTEAQAAPYYGGLNSVFDFPLAKVLVAAAASETSPDLGSYVAKAWRVFRRNAQGQIVDSPFIGNHDRDRVLDQLRGNMSHMRMAAAMLLTLPGDPFVYYGEEIGLHGIKPDERIREPMRWDRNPHQAGETWWEAASDNASPALSVAAERADPHSLLSFYRRLIHWRIELPALRDGAIASYPVDGGAISAYTRTDDAQQLLVIHNLSGVQRGVSLPDASFRAIIRRTRPGIRLHGRNLTMPAYSTAILTAGSQGEGADVRLSGGTLSLRLIGGSVLHVHFIPHTGATPPTLVMAPRATDDAHETSVDASQQGSDLMLRNGRLRAALDQRSGTLTMFAAGAERPLLRVVHASSLAGGAIMLRFAGGAPLYGVGGTNAFDQKPAEQPLRQGRHVATAGIQGDAGAPLLWSTAGFAVLVDDSKGAAFDVTRGGLRISDLSRPDPDFYLIAGDPRTIFAAVADLSGHAPLFPKWSLGFINSQWGIDQTELLQEVRTYRAKHIPLDAFELDFDWKAWGQDGYGEFRWNPQKFPDGPSGELARRLDASGVHLIGIMKPRIHLDTEEGRYATAHGLWIPGEKASLDYFSHQPAKDLDFDNTATRDWFFNPTLQHSFDTGIVGWWNDEADEAGGDTQFLNMERALYEGQRRHSDARVFSLNRNFWLGAQRYAYGLWSGDIQTGFATMARQRSRMLSAIDVGEMWWSMDGGGFHGHPSDENYARWMEFGAFTPIFRVHGTYGEKRQPWRYGPIAERAAAHAVRLRYQLLPYMYSYAWNDHVAGVGLVRPLTFGWPRDPKVRKDSSAWLFGQYLLVSPIVEQGQTEKRLYLPGGIWTDWSSGRVYLGSRTIDLPIDSATWGDIPLFIRQGAIIPTQPVEDYVGERPVRTVRVEVFPDSTRTDFDYYDDDGKSYAYEHGAYFLQRLSAQATGGAVRLTTAASSGSYQPALTHYVFAVHRTVASQVTRDDGPVARVGDLTALQHCANACWTIGGDRYGGVTYIKLPAGLAARVQMK